VCVCVCVWVSRWTSCLLSPLTCLICRVRLRGASRMKPLDLRVCVYTRMCEQHTATHCITLQHAAAHCNTLQYAATRCSHHSPMLQDLCVFVYTKMCVYEVWLCADVRIHICIYMFVYTFINVCVNINRCMEFGCVQMYTYTSIYICIHIYIYVCKYE